MEMEGGKHSTKVLASHPADPGSIPSVPQKNAEEKLSMLPRLIKGAG